MPATATCSRMGDMSAISVLVFVLCAYGLTQILVFSAYLSHIDPHITFHCPMCGLGWVLLVLLNPFTELFTFDVTVVNALLSWLSSGTSYVVYADIRWGFQHIIELKGWTQKWRLETSRQVLQVVVRAVAPAL